MKKKKTLCIAFIASLAISDCCYCFHTWNKTEKRVRVRERERENYYYDCATLPWCVHRVALCAAIHSTHIYKARGTLWCGQDPCKHQLHTHTNEHCNEPRCSVLHSHFIWRCASRSRKRFWISTNDCYYHFNSQCFYLFLSRSFQFVFLLPAYCRISLFFVYFYFCLLW